MLHGHSAGDALVGVESDARLEQIEAVFVKPVRVGAQRCAFPLGESGLEVGQLES